MSFEKYLKYKTKYLELKNSNQNNGITLSNSSLKGGASIEINTIYNIPKKEHEKCISVLKSPPPEVLTDEYLRCFAHIEGQKLLSSWLDKRSIQIKQVLELFDTKGIPFSPPSATTFSDLY